MNQFVCGADIAYKGKVSYATDYMGIFDTVDEAVVANKDLHLSFGYIIYEVKRNVTNGLIRGFGIRAGSKCSGNKIVSKVCLAYAHPAWGK